MYYVQFVIIFLSEWYARSEKKHKVLILRFFIIAIIFQPSYPPFQIPVLSAGKNHQREDMVYIYLKKDSYSKLNKFCIWFEFLNNLHVFKNIFMVKAFRYLIMYKPIQLFSQGYKISS